MPLAGDDWRYSLFIWAIPILLIAMLVALVRLPAEPGAAEKSASSLPPSRALPKWSDARVWQYGLLLTSAVVAFFVINAYSAVVLQARGETAALKGLLFAYNATPLIASFIVLAAPGWIGARKPVALSSLLSVIGLAGFVLLESWASWFSALVTGCASTVALILMVSLPPAIARGTAITRLSAGMTLIGFAISFLLILIGGWLSDTTGWIEMASIPSLVFMIAALAALGKSARYPDYE